MKNRNLIDRIHFVLGNRKITPWAKSIGLKATDVTRIKNGHILGPEKLVPICRAENVSLTWLLEGSGEPYMVHHTYSDAETAELLTDHTNDEAWNILVLKSQVFPAIILTLPSTMLVGENEVHYTAIEIIAGPVGSETLQSIHKCNVLGKEPVKELGLDEFTLRKLYAGKLGNQDIFGEGSDPLFKRDIKPFSGYLPDNNAAADKPQVLIDIDILRSAIAYIEGVAHDEGQPLNTEQKSKAIAMLYRQMQRTHSIEVDRNTVLMTLDAV